MYFPPVLLLATALISAESFVFDLQDPVPILTRHLFILDFTVKNKREKPISLADGMITLGRRIEYTSPEDAERYQTLVILGGHIIDGVRGDVAIDIRHTDQYSVGGLDKIHIRLVLACMSLNKESPPQHLFRGNKFVFSNYVMSPVLMNNYLEKNRAEIDDYYRQASGSPFGAELSPSPDAPTYLPPFTPVGNDF